MELNSSLIGKAQHVQYLIKMEGKWQILSSNSKPLFLYHIESCGEIQNMGIIAEARKRITQGI